MLALFLIASIFAIVEGSPQRNILLNIAVVGGSPADTSEYPYLVQIHFISKEKEDRCSGSAVAKRWVLTAAHCIKDSENSPRYLVWSSTTWDPWQDDPEVPVNCAKDCYIHPEYVEKTHDNDVALIYVRGKKLLKQKQIIHLGTVTPATGRSLRVAGWGMGPDDPDMHLLHEVQVPVVEISKCNKSYDGGVTQHMLCAGYDEGGKDACSGDSGGPAVIQRRDGEFAVVGIVSFGFFCGVPRYYGVYTDVASELPWIETTMASR